MYLKRRHSSNVRSHIGRLPARGKSCPSFPLSDRLDRCRWCFIFNGSSKRISAGIQSRSVCGYDLETGSGLSGGICRTVQGKTGCFLSASAYDRLYFSGRLFHNDNRSLRLWGNVPTLVDRIILCDAERGFIFVHCSLRFFRGSKDQGIIFSPCG